MLETRGQKFICGTKLSDLAFLFFFRLLLAYDFRGSWSAFCGFSRLLAANSDHSEQRFFALSHHCNALGQRNVADVEGLVELEVDQIHVKSIRNLIWQAADGYCAEMSFQETTFANTNWNSDAMNCHFKVVFLIHAYAIKIHVEVATAKWVALDLADDCNRFATGNARAAQINKPSFCIAARHELFEFAVIKCHFFGIGTGPVNNGGYLTGYPQAPVGASTSFGTAVYCKVKTFHFCCFLKVSRLVAGGPS